MIAKAFGVSRKTVQNVISQADMLRASVVREGGSQRIQLKATERFTVINEAMHRWYDGMREKNGEIPLLEHVIRHKALKIAEALGIREFRASKGWYRSWKNSHALALV